MKNLVEYALEDGGGSGVLSENTLTFTKRGAPYGSEITYTIETSTDLGITDEWAVVVTGRVENDSLISYTFSPGAPDKKFVRLRITQAP